MRPIRYTIKSILILLFCQLTLPALGQLGTGIDIKKPKEYEERVLRSEKSTEKKFTLPKRFFQNGFTHYNYFFNANVKLNEVIEKAKLSFKDDYSELLPFYNYSLDMTAGDSLQIDSIISKSQTGIALHDLRNDWIDNLYLLWGAGYYLRKDFDSAYLMFQYINYAFAEKEKDGYFKTIGSRADGNVAYSISTKEKTGLPRKIFAEPPSRNEAFIWQIRNFLAQDLFAEASSLIVTLKNDPVFPKRLQNDLEEVQAYMFYKQGNWDSSAAHLENALDVAVNKQEKARWEFLLAQLYEMTGRYKESEAFYAKAINHTIDPILDVYARLYSIRVNKDGGENYIEKNIETLLKMAKRDRYTEYRDIIYYMAAQMQLERNNVEGAMALLLKSTQYANNNPSQRNRAFLQLAELNFKKRLYRPSYNFYDSIRMDDPMLKDPEGITTRKQDLYKVAMNLDILERQDSLIRIAALPEDERKAFVKALVKKIRKQQGLKADEVLTTGSAFQPLVPTALFAENDTKGEWYFYNSTQRQKGVSTFKSRWGNRPNADNWRRSAAISGVIAKNTQQNAAAKGQDLKGLANDMPTEATYDGLYDNLPLTPDKQKISSDSIEQALYELGKAYIQGIEDCAAGTETYERLRSSFPLFQQMDEVLFNLYYCYNKNGETAKAAAIKQAMNDKYGDSHFTTIVTTGKDPLAKNGNEKATKTYEHIYDLFIEGQFAEAIAQKKTADSLYDKNFWTPQLLYIEAVYYVKQREDSTAVGALNNIITQFPGTPIAGRATNLISVLGRRKQIEEELEKLQITRPIDSAARQHVYYDSTLVAVKTDTARNISQPQIVQTPVPVINKPVVDTITKQPVVVAPPTANFAFAPETPQYVVLILTKVDPIFSSEAKNAFYRYNRENFYNKQFALDLIDIDAENKFMLISPFKNVDEAMVYIDKTRPKTATEIIPWLKGGKYVYTIISEKNLDILKSSKNVDNYKTFLNQHLPGKF